MSWFGGYFGGGASAPAQALPLSRRPRTILEKILDVLEREFHPDENIEVFLNLADSAVEDDEDDEPIQSVVVVKLAGTALPSSGQEIRISVAIFAHAVTAAPLERMISRAINAIEDAETLSVVDRNFALEDFDQATGPEGTFRTEATLEVRG